MIPAISERRAVVGVIQTTRGKMPCAELFAAGPPVADVGVQLPGERAAAFGAEVDLGEGEVFVGAAGECGRARRA